MQYAVGAGATVTAGVANSHSRQRRSSHRRLSIAGPCSRRSEPWARKHATCSSTPLSQEQHGQTDHAQTDLDMQVFLRAHVARRAPRHRRLRHSHSQSCTACREERWPSRKGLRLHRIRNQTNNSAFSLSGSDAPNRRLVRDAGRPGHTGRTTQRTVASAMQAPSTTCEHQHKDVQRKT